MRRLSLRKNADFIISGFMVFFPPFDTTSVLKWSRDSGTLGLRAYFLREQLNKLATRLHCLRRPTCQGIQVVQMEERFCNTDSYPVLRYYKSDHIHLSRSGVRRLLDAIEKTCKDVSLVDNYEHCAFGRVSAADKQTTQGQSSQSGSKRQDQHTEWRRQPQRNQRGYQQGNQRRNQRGNQRPNQPSGLSRNQNCMKCGESNHSTFDCRHKEQIKCYLCGFYGHKQLNCPNQ